MQVWLKFWFGLGCPCDTIFFPIPTTYHCYGYIRCSFKFYAQKLFGLKVPNPSFCTPNKGKKNEKCVENVDLPDVENLEINDVIWNPITFEKEKKLNVVVV